MATVLMAGTFALSFPSLMTIDAAQAQPYYGGMDGYGSSDYKIYNDRKSYDNGYESQYPSSYKPDYKSQYQSYGKDDSRDKSTKDSKVDINKLKCINANLNINGNNAGNVSIGNKGIADAEEGYSGAYSSSDSGYGDKRYYDDGYNNNKQDKGFDCVINNNNNNTNIVAGAGGGNVTDGNGNVTEPQTCEECFRAFLTQGQITNLIGTTPLEEHCNSLESLGVDESAFRENLAFAGVSMTNINALIECLINVGIQFSP